MIFLKLDGLTDAYALLDAIHDGQRALETAICNCMGEDLRNYYRGRHARLVLTEEALREAIAEAESLG